MMKIITSRIMIGLFVAVMSFGIFAYFQPANALAQANLVCDGLSPNQSGGSCDAPTSGEPQVDSVLGDVLGILSLVAGIIAVIMIIIAAVRFMTSQGDAGKVASARTTIMYAVIGIIVVALAQTIIFFVVDKAVNPPPTNPTTPVCNGRNCPVAI